MRVSCPPSFFGFSGLRWRPAVDGSQPRWRVPVPPGQVGKKVVAVVHEVDRRRWSYSSAQQ